MRHGVLHEMELAALPGHPGENGLPSSLESGVVVTDHELHASQTAVDETLEEGSPARLSLAELHAAAQDAPLAVGADANGRDLAGADALHVHLGDDQGHRPFAADAPLERPGVERSPVLVAR
jgi:hypothetical protein